jgi:hypothetical protein
VLEQQFSTDHDCPEAITVDVGQRQDYKWHDGSKWEVVEVGDVWGSGTYGAGKAYLAAQRTRFNQLRKGNP